MSSPSMVYINQCENAAELVFNRPALLNAANWEWINAFHVAMDQLERTEGLRAVIVRGEGRSFSTGIDLKALAAGELQIDWFRRFDEGVRRLEQLSALTIAKVRGHCMGGGLQMALGCDLRVAAPDASFGLPAVLEALIPGLGTYRLPRFIGLGRARRMVLTGEMIPADEALQIGLVDWVVPAEKLDETIRILVDDLQKGSAVAQRFAKKLVTDSFDSTFEQAFSSYMDYQQITIGSEQHKQAMAAYRTRKMKPEAVS